MTKIYTSRKLNTAGQRAIDCLDYNCSSDINETCNRFNDCDNLCACKVRFGEVCEHYEGSK